jgi:hypothetical protein
MNFFSTHSKPSNIKTHLWLAVSLSLMLITQTAHADFRKALDAYQARDGATMIKEVKDAVDKKSDDGLMLLLMATNMDAATSDYDETTEQSKSTLRAILPQPKWDEMRELLVQATNNSTVDAQYYLLTNTPFKGDLYKKYLNLELKGTTITRLTNQQYSDAEHKIIDEYVKRGSKLAMLNTSNNIFTKAEADDPTSQMQLGLAYSKSGRYATWQNNQPPAFKSLEKDITKGEYWLKRAAKSYEITGYEDGDLFARNMCEFFRSTANGDKYKLKQAYLWAIKGMNEYSEPSESSQCIRDMYDSNDLKIAAPEVYAVYTTLPDKSKFNALVYQTEIKELPDWVVEIRKELEKQALPVFSYYFNDDGIVLEIYNDGRVFMYSIGSGITNDRKNMLMKVSTKKVKEFLLALNKTGFNQWTTENAEPAICDQHRCSVTQMQIVSRNSKKTRKLFLRELYYKELDEASFLKYKMSNYEIEEYKKIMTIRKKSKFNVAFAKVKALVDENFSTRQLRCELGNPGQKQQQCKQRDKFWLTIAKQEK